MQKARTKPLSKKSSKKSLHENPNPKKKSKKVAPTTDFDDTEVKKFIQNRNEEMKENIQKVDLKKTRSGKENLVKSAKNPKIPKEESTREDDDFRKNP